MKTLRYPQDVRTTRAVSNERAYASAVPPELSFAFGGLVVAGPDSVEVSGRLTHPLPRESVVVVFPAPGTGPFYARFVAQPGFDWYRPDDPERPKDLPPPQPPVPPPPVELVLPPECVVVFTTVLRLKPMKYAGAPEVEVEWSFLFWNEPKPKGRLSVRLPPR